VKQVISLIIDVEDEEEEDPDVKLERELRTPMD